MTVFQTNPDVISPYARDMAERVERFVREVIIP